MALPCFAHLFACLGPLMVRRPARSSHGSCGGRMTCCVVNACAVSAGAHILAGCDEYMNVQVVRCCMLHRSLMRTKASRNECACGLPLHATMSEDRMGTTASGNPLLSIGTGNLDSSCKQPGNMCEPRCFCSLVIALYATTAVWPW